MYNTIKQLIELYKEKYSNNIIAGYRNGFFNKSEEEGIANEQREEANEESQSALWPAMFPRSRTSNGRAPRRAAAYAQGRQRPIY